MFYVVSASFTSSTTSVHSAKVAKYKRYERDLSISEICYLVTLKSVDRFERQKPNISIGVFRYENKKVFPLCITEERERHHLVNLPRLTHRTENYLLIKDLCRLDNLQYCKHQQSRYFCSYCLHGCNLQEVLGKHIDICKQHDFQRILLPQKNDEKGWNKITAAKKLLSITIGHTC